MARRTGKLMRLPAERRLVCDVINIARRMPTAPIERTLDLEDVHAIRKRVRPRISWQVVMMRAYALVARDNPALRQIYVPFPWPHIYEHSESVALVTINRQIDGVNWLLFARFNEPETRPLDELQEQFDDYRRKPVREIKQLNHQIRFAKLPWPIRQIGWRLMTGLMPSGRARQMGTFGMSLSGYRQAKGSFHLGPCTTVLGYDQFCAGGKARLTLTFDHRILDGMPVNEVLESLRNVLVTEIKDELSSLARRTTTATERFKPHPVDSGSQIRPWVPVNRPSRDLPKPSLNTPRVIELVD